VAYENLSHLATACRGYIGLRERGPGCCQCCKSAVEVQPPGGRPKGGRSLAPDRRRFSAPADQGLLTALCRWRPSNSGRTDVCGCAGPGLRCQRSALSRAGRRSDSARRLAATCPSVAYALAALLPSHRGGRRPCCARPPAPQVRYFAGDRDSETSKPKRPRQVRGLANLARPAGPSPAGLSGSA